ncbi:MAG: hypothetical protein AABY32_06865 [Nanoarchaeota archaeon]
MVIHKPESKKIMGIKIRGAVTDCEKNKWFIFDIRPKNRDFRDELKELRPRVQKVENGDYKYFKQTFKGAIVHLIYLNWESAKGLYKDSNNNLPYEVLDMYGGLVYRQSRIERKEDIFNRLERIAKEKGLKE